MSQRNAFLAMAALADRESWCWSLYCTTCGCREFRHGLRELANGRHPDSAHWAIHRDSLPRRFRSIPAVLTVTEQAAVSAIVSQIDVKDLAKSCKFPNWLGYLGLVLEQTVEAEQATRLLTNTLLPQLIAAIDDPHERAMSGDLFTGDALLHWQDLEHFEAALRFSSGVSG